MMHQERHVRGPLAAAALTVVLVLACSAPADATTSSANTTVPASTLGTHVDEPQIARHTRAIAATLRCLVCQGENVADSQSSLAADMRRQIHQKLALGWSEQRIRDYFVARYGDFVLYRPPLKASTWFLWFAPLTALLLGLLGLLVFVRRRARVASPAPLTPAEMARARAILRHPEETS